MQVDLAALPTPAERNIALHVRPAAERAIRGGHPWLFADSIRRQSRAGEPGDLAVIFDRKDRFLAVGLYDPTSEVRVRILQQGQPAPINRAWLQARLAEAKARRAPLSDQKTTGYRLVHGENDGLPGLVVDAYDTTYVVKLYSVAWVPYLQHLVTIIRSLIDCQRLVLRLSRAVSRQSRHLHGLEEGDLLYGSPLTGPVRFLENNLHFAADVIAGHKTGFFFDQRDNRARIGQLIDGHGGLERVLNVFAYTGGFSLYAARGGASAITSTDLSAPALAAAEVNFGLNRHIPAVAAAVHRTVVGDAFAVLTELGAQEIGFDAVLVDPPAFAQRRTEVSAALKAYYRLTELALAVLRPGGLLMISSCSSRVEAAAFYQTVTSAANNSGRLLSEHGRTGHPLDHPVGFPEGAYLKAFFAWAR